MYASILQYSDSLFCSYILIQSLGRNQTDELQFLFVTFNLISGYLSILNDCKSINFVYKGQDHT